MWGWIILIIFILLFPHAAMFIAGLLALPFVLVFGAGIVVFLIILILKVVFRIN